MKQNFQIQPNDTHSVARNWRYLPAFILIFCSMQFAYGQNTGKWKTSGNTVDSSAYIGTNNASCLRFRSNNVEQMRITESGKVGIGVANPQAKLQVNGKVRIDSSLLVQDSAVFTKTAHIKGDLNIDGNVAMNHGNLSIKSLGDTALQTNGVVMVDEEGNVVNGGSLQNLLYNPPTVPSAAECPQDINGNILYAPPRWRFENHGMFLLDEQCHYTPRLGVGVKPQAKVHIRLHDGEDLSPLLIEKYKNGNPYKLLQLDKNGLLHAREVKVDLATWPDYVFHKDYHLMPLREVKTFIYKNGHLPNVPTAEKVEKEGVNLGEVAKTSMQKIEELTLYLLQINEKVTLQEKITAAQQKLIKQQQKTIALQQQLIKELKEKVTIKK